MNDDMDLRLDEVIRRTFHAVALPATPASLRWAIDDLPRTAPPARTSTRHRAALATIAAGIVVIAVVALNGLFGPTAPVLGPAITASPAPTPRPTPSPLSSTFPAFSIANLLAGRAAGTIEDEPVIAFGWYSDLRETAVDPCPSAAPSPGQPDCLSLRQGLMDDEVPVGAVVDGRWTPSSLPSLHPVWPARLRDDPRAARFFAITGPDQEGKRPIFVLLAGHFVADAFVVDEILQFDDPFAIGSPTPSATPFPSGSLPAPPAPITRCTEPRAPEAAASGDPIPTRLASEGWVAKDDVPFPFLGATIADDMVYVGIVEGDIPLGVWLDDPAGAGRFRWWGTSTCVADSNSIWFGWLPGSTYRIFEDGHRVDGGDPFDPQPSPSRT